MHRNGRQRVAGMTPVRTRLRVALAIPVIGLAALSVSCSHNNSDASAPSRTLAARARRVSTPTTVTPSRVADAPRPLPAKTTAAQEVVARYVAFWRARFAANRNVPDPNDPSLRRLATGPQLDAVIAETRRNLTGRLAFRRSDHPADLQRVAVVSLNANRAVVQECVVSDDVVVRRDTGAVVDDDVATHNVRGELLRTDGVWKVSSTQLVQHWEGVAGCALASS